MLSISSAKKAQWVKNAICAAVTGKMELPFALPDYSKSRHRFRPVHRHRTLVRKGVLTREEGRQILLAAAISRSIEAEALRQESGVSEVTKELNDQSVEILKFIAEHL